MTRASPYGIAEYAKNNVELKCAFLKAERAETIGSGPPPKDLWRWKFLREPWLKCKSGEDGGHEPLRRHCEVEVEAPQ